ncbi:MAG: hypothetical protein R3E76_00725 [Planctomycetota bacterium]
MNITYLIEAYECSGNQLMFESSPLNIPYPRLCELFGLPENAGRVDIEGYPVKPAQWDEVTKVLGMKSINPDVVEMFVSCRVDNE